MKWIKNLNVLQYSIFSYIIFFSLIFVPMSFVWYLTSKESVTQQIELSSKNFFLQAKTNFESNLGELDLVSQQLPHDSLISFEKLSSPFESIKGRSALAKYRLKNSFIDQIYLFYPDQPELIFSPNGHTKVDVLLDAKDAKINNKDFMNLVSSAAPNFVTLETSNNQKKSFFYIVPTQDSYRVSNAVMIYVINKSSMDNIFSPISNNNQEKFFLIDNESNSFDFSSDNGHLTNTLQEMISQRKTLPKTLHQKNEKYIFHQSENNVLNLTYLYAVNANMALLGLTNIYKLSILVLIIVLIAGIFSSIFLGRQSYRPYKKIESLLLKYDSIEQKRKRLSFDDIQKKVSNFASENHYLKEEIKQQQPYIQEMLLHQLLTGQLTDEHGIADLLPPDFINQKNIYYLSIIISLESVDSLFINHELDSPRLLAELNKQSFSHFKWVGTKCLEKEAVTFLVITNNNGSQHGIIEDIIKVFVKLYGFSPVIGIGTFKTDWRGIKHSFVEALTAIDHRYPNHQNNIFLFDDISNTQEESATAFNFPDDKQLKLLQSLNLGNEMVSLEILSELISYGVHHCQSFQIFRMYSYYLINTFARIGSKTTGDRFFIELESIIDVKNYQKLELHLQNITRLICSDIEFLKLNKEEKEKERLFKYISDNYHLDTLSLESASDDLDLSSTTINKIMKEETDTTFSKHISDLRFTKIKEELIQTNHSVKEIIQRNGYYDVSNFTRKFRVLVGVTPGKYRTIHRDPELYN